MGMNNNCRKKRCFHLCQETKDIGFVLLVFGAVTICAFFLPPKAWLILLGVILIICGCVLMKRCIAALQMSSMPVIHEKELS